MIDELQLQPAEITPPEEVAPAPAELAEAEKQQEIEASLHCLQCGEKGELYGAEPTFGGKPVLNEHGYCKTCWYEKTRNFGKTLTSPKAAFPPKVDKSNTLEAAKSIIPLLAGDRISEKKAEYLAYRYTGFSFSEAVEMTGIHWKTVYRWRFDQTFLSLEEQASGPARGEIRKEVMHLLWVRNMHLKLRQDFSVLRRAAKLELAPDGSPLPLEPGDREYLSKLAALYTPQQLEIIERILDGEQQRGGPMSFSDFILEISRERERTTVRVQGKQVTEAESVPQRSSEAALNPGSSEEEPEQSS